MNKQDQIIFFEELSRAAALLTLKKQCNEQEYKNFLTILENYENNLVLTESKAQGSEKYKGFLNFFAESKLLQEAMIPNIDVFQKLDAETQAEVLKKIPEGDLKEKYKKVVKPAEASDEKSDETSDKPEEEQKGSDLFQQLPPVDRVKLQAKGIKKDMDPVELAKYILKSKDSVGRPDMSDIGKMEAEQFLKARNIPTPKEEPKEKPKEEPKAAARGDALANDIENFSKDNDDPIASELGKLAAQYVDNYGGFFNQLATNVWGLFNPRKFQQYRRQQILGLLAMLKKQAGEAGVPGSDKIETGAEAVETAQEEAEKGEEGETEKKKPVRIRSIQRPIISVVQRVAAAQGVDMSVRQAQDIAIAITKNLADQMRANGVIFRGDKPKPEEKETEAVNESKNIWENKDIKRLFFEHLNYIISEERLAAKYGMKKEKFSAKEIGLDKRYKFGAVEPRDYIKTFKAVMRRFQEMGYKQKQTHYELKNTDNADNFVDYYDMYLDLQDLRKFNRGTKRVAKDGEESDTIDDARKNIDYMIKKFELHGDFRDKSTAKEMKKKYIQLKKKMKGIGGKEKKTTAKDLSMGAAQKGKINISQTVAKAIQKGGLDKDVAKKITPILKNKIEKIISKSIGADVEIVEEKIQRYVKTVINEINLGEQ